LQQTLTVNGKVAGMPVASSSVTTNGGSANTPSTSISNSWVIIVAVVVPVVFLRNN